jgi:nucleotide-binding universal stress UspA family protein
MRSAVDGRPLFAARSSTRQSRTEVDVNESIVCGVDGSPDSQRALTVAARFAHRLEARLIVASVVADVREPAIPAVSYVPMAYPVEKDLPLTATRTEVELEAAQALLERMVKYARATDAELKALVGDPAERLADLADDEDATLIVVGSRGRGRFRAAFLGSVSQSLVGVARCPVLVVPHDAGPVHAA